MSPSCASNSSEAIWSEIRTLTTFVHRFYMEQCNIVIKTNPYTQALKKKRIKKINTLRPL